jgi:hypothetical protein
MRKPHTQKQQVTKLLQEGILSLQEISEKTQTTRKYIYQIKYRMKKGKTSTKKKGIDIGALNLKKTKEQVLLLQKDNNVLTVALEERNIELQKAHQLIGKLSLQNEE